VDFKEAGTQVVGGTVEAKEELELAMLREIKEESGLQFTRLDLNYLGETFYQRKDKNELNRRHYFQVNSNALPETFQHTVISDGEDRGLRFNFYWLDLKEASLALTGNFFEMFDKIN
jgi:8-oxo-dGTP diphosphatase